MASNPEQKNEQIEQVDQIKQNAEKLNKLEANTLGKTMEKKNINNPEAKDIKNPRENVFDKDGKYKLQYLEFVNKIADRPKLLQQIIDIGKEKGFGTYVTDKESFVRFATDNKRGDLHDYLKDKFPDMTDTPKNWQDVEKPNDIDKLLENNKVDNEHVRGKVGGLGVMDMALYDNIKINSKIFFDLLASGKNIPEAVDTMKTEPIRSQLGLTKEGSIVNYASFREKNQYQKLIDTKIQENFRSPAIGLTQMADTQKEA